MLFLILLFFRFKIKTVPAFGKYDCNKFKANDNRRIWKGVFREAIMRYLSSSSSSLCRTASTNLPDPLTLPVSIVHRSRQIFLATSCTGTELLCISSSWSSNLCLSMWRGPLEYITYEFVFTSPAVSRMPGLSDLNRIRDGW